MISEMLSNIGGSMESRRHYNEHIAVLPWAGGLIIKEMEGLILCDVLCLRATSQASKVCTLPAWLASYCTLRSRLLNRAIEREEI